MKKTIERMILKWYEDGITLDKIEKRVKANGKRTN